MPQLNSPIVVFAQYLAKLTDGWKTISGTIMLIGGLLAFVLTPEWKDEGVALAGAGLQLLIVGLVHKASKISEAAKEVLK